MDDTDEIAELEARLAELRKAKDDAAPPPHQPVNERPSAAPVVVGLVVAGVIGIAAAVSWNGAVSEKPDLIIDGEPYASKSPSTPVEAPFRPEWTYSESVDELTDKITRTACITSTNKVALDWPYDDVHARLCLRDSPRYGKDAYVSLIGEGQIICRSYDDCTVSVRFDDAPVQRFSAVDAADGSSNIFFFTNRTRLERGIATASRTLVSARFYQAGEQTMTFETTGFEWPKKNGNG